MPLAPIKPVPTTNSINQAIKMATTPEAAHYLVERVVSVFAAAKIDEPEVVRSLQNFADAVERQNQTSFQPWNGDTAILNVTTPNMEQNINYQIAMRKEQAETIGDKSVVVGFAVNEEGQFIRGYSSGDESVDDETRDALDGLLNGCVVSHKMGILDGTVYQANVGTNITANGEESYLIDYPKDNEGKAIKADPQAVRDALLNPEDGLKEYAAKRSPALKIEVQEYAFPEEQLTPSDESRTTLG